MAQLEVDPKTGVPRCSGCGATLYFLPHQLDSAVRRPFTPEAALRGSLGPTVRDFAAHHAACAEPRDEVLPSGTQCRDRRAR